MEGGESAAQFVAKVFFFFFFSYVKSARKLGSRSVLREGRSRAPQARNPSLRLQAARIA